MPVRIKGKDAQALKELIHAASNAPAIPSIKKLRARHKDGRKRSKRRTKRKLGIVCCVKLMPDGTYWQIDPNNDYDEPKGLQK